MTVIMLFFFSRCVTNCDIEWITMTCIWPYDVRFIDIDNRIHCVIDLKTFKSWNLKTLAYFTSVFNFFIIWETLYSIKTTTLININISKVHCCVFVPYIDATFFKGCSMTIEFWRNNKKNINVWENYIRLP